MSKPRLHHARLHSTIASPNSLVKHLVRMGVYWLCATLLFWSSQHPLVVWGLSTLMLFFVASSIVVPTLAYLSFWLRAHDGNTPYLASDKFRHSFTQSLTQTGRIALELFMALMAAVAVARLLF